MKKNTVKLNEAQLRKLVAETISEIADSNGYYEILNYLHDIKGTPDGARILDGLYGESAMGEENAIAELKEIFPEAHPKAIEAAIWDFKREMEDDDEYSMVMESKVKKAVKESIKKVLKEEYILPDTNNVVPQEIAEKFGFEPEYQGYGNGLEIWSVHPNFDPVKDYKQVASICRQMGIKRPTSYSSYPSKTISITVKPSAPKTNNKPNKSAFINPKDGAPAPAKRNGGLKSLNNKDWVSTVSESRVKKAVSESIKKVLSEK